MLTPNPEKQNTIHFLTTNYHDQDDFKDSSSSTNNSFMQPYEFLSSKNSSKNSSNIKIRRLNCQKNPAKILEKQYFSSNNRTHKTQYPELTNLHKIINSGKYIYMNVLGEEGDHIRVVEPDGLQSAQDRNQNRFNFYGCDYTNLSNEQKQLIDYLNVQYQSKQNEAEIKTLIKDKFMKLNQKIEIGQHSKLITQESTIQTNTDRTELFTHPTSFVKIKNTRDNLSKNRQPLQNNNNNLNQKFINGLLKLFKEQEKSKHFSTKFQVNNFQSDEQLIKKWIKQQRIINNKCCLFKKQKLENIDKYNLEFIDYLKTKSNKRIEKNLMEKLRQKKENIIQQYQQHILNELNMPKKNKQKIRKCFEKINQETKRIQTNL